MKLDYERNAPAFKLIDAVSEMRGLRTQLEYLLEPIARSLYTLGMEKAANKIDAALELVSARVENLSNAHVDNIHAEVAASQQATANMMTAFIAGLGHDKTEVDVDAT